MLLLLCEGYSCENFWHYICSFKKRKENILVPCWIRQGISECRTKSFANNFRLSGNVFLIILSITSEFCLCNGWLCSSLRTCWNFRNVKSSSPSGISGRKLSTPQHRVIFFDVSPSKLFPAFFFPPNVCLLARISGIASFIRYLLFLNCVFIRPCQRLTASL